MRRLFVLALAMILPGCGSVVVRTADFLGTTSSSGTVAPLVGGTGIALGSTQLHAGGFPGDPIAPGDPSSANTTCLAPTMSSATPDNLSSAIVIGTTGTAVDPAQSLGCAPHTAPGSTAVTSLGGAVVPLGAADTSTAGLSPPLVVPVPSGSASSCSRIANSLCLSATALGSASSAPGAPGSFLSLPFSC
jgi:hypothetical protein